MFISRNKLNQLQNRIDELERNVWDLKNPPKYQIRDRVDVSTNDPYQSTFEATGIVVSTEVRKSIRFYRDYTILTDDNEICECCEQEIKKIL